MGRSGVDFYFEEGGCWGMALALYRMFKKQGKDPRYCLGKTFVHAFVECDGKFYDSDGEFKPCFVYKGIDDLFKYAAKHGVDREKVEADAATAAEIIEDIHKSYFPPELAKKEIGKEDFEQWNVKASSRQEAAELVWKTHGDRLLKLMKPNETRRPGKSACTSRTPRRG